MRVLEVSKDGAVCVDEVGMRHEVAVDLVGTVALGERVLVHAGVAIGTMA
jgi:hydrogenase maturation factor